MFNSAKKKIEVLNDQKNVFSFLRLLNFFFFISGFVYCQALLFYDGKSPVNVFYLFFFLVAFQIISIIIGTIFFEDISKNFIFKGFQNISLRFFTLFGGLSDLLSEKLLKREFIFNSILFNIGVLIAILVKVSFFDVAFGWSTSLDISEYSIKIFTDVISTPWNWFWDSARPSLDLIKKTHFFRVNSKFTEVDLHNLKNLKAMGKWWQFFFASVLVYGVIPRLIFLFSLRERKEDLSEEKSLFLYDDQDISSLFELNDFERKFFNSILNLVLENDYKVSPSEEKLKWYEQWKSSIEISTDLFEKDLLIETLKNSTEKLNLKVLVLFCEISTFEPYISDAGKVLAQFDKKVAVSYLQKLITLINFSNDELIKFNDKLEVNLKEKKTFGLFTKVLGLAVLSTAVIALSGGLGVGAVGVLGKALGVATVAGKVTGVILLSGGLLMATGFEEEGQKIFVGTGTIFAGIKDALSEPMFEKYMATEEAMLRDLRKLETYIELKFFNDEYFKESTNSLLKYLGRFRDLIESRESNSKKKLLLGEIEALEEKISATIF